MSKEAILIFLNHLSFEFDFYFINYYYIGSEKLSPYLFLSNCSSAKTINAGNMRNRLQENMPEPVSMVTLFPITPQSVLRLQWHHRTHTLTHTHISKNTATNTDIHLHKSRHICAYTRTHTHTIIQMFRHTHLFLLAHNQTCYMILRRVCVCVCVSVFDILGGE